MAFLLGQKGDVPMGSRIVILCVGAVLWSTVGCGRRARVELPNMRIPVSCASEIQLVGCDARVSPPKCRSARVTYRRGCEEIEVRR